MFIVLTGPPGAGKTYNAVKQIAETTTDVKIITNVDSLQIPHVSLDKLMMSKRYGNDPKKFFTVDEQKKLIEKYDKILYVIDECQTYFDRKFYDKNVFFLFQYHRHLGLSFILITQHIMNIPRELQVLAEYELWAVRRSMNFFNTFRYNMLCGGQLVDRKMIKPKETYFKLYQSQLKDEHQKPKNPMVKYILLAVFFFLFTIGLFYHNVIGGWSRKAEAAKLESEQSEAKNTVASNTNKGSTIQHAGFSSADVFQGDQYTWFQIGFLRSGSRLWVQSPITNEFTPYSDCGFKIKMIQEGEKLVCYGYVPVSVAKQVASERSARTTGKPGPWAVSGGSLQAGQRPEAPAEPLGWKPEVIRSELERNRF